MDDHQQRHTKLNVVGKVFETTVSTLHRVGPNSLLTVLSISNAHPSFIDRHLDLFSVLLSLLRLVHRQFSNSDIVNFKTSYVQQRLGSIQER